jgi:hypothetical protein
MSGDAKRPRQTFELKAGPMPALKPAPPPRPPESKQPEGSSADLPADEAAPGCLSQKAIILRLVETVKAL